MESHLPYILNVAIAITVFYLAYILLFRKEKIFLFNRFYLIMSMLVSFIIPLITFSEQAIVSENMMPAQWLQVSAPTQLADVPLTSPGFNWKHIPEIILISGFIFFLTSFIIGHLKVWQIVRKTSKIDINNHSVRITNKNIPPFTYFGKLIIPSHILDSPHLQSVIYHERIHAKGQHCIDLCISEILFLFQWFNPFAWLMKNAVRDNLEFLTDDEAVYHIDKQEYQLGIVSLASKNTFHSFPSVSNKSQLKKRIIMIKKNTTNRFPWIKSLAIIPILTILTITLSGREVQIIYPASEVEKRVLVTVNNDLGGKVTDKNDNAIAGVSVTVNGSNIGTTTDKDGRFILKNISNNIDISFTKSGYDKEEVNIQKFFNSQFSDSLNNEAYTIKIDSIFVQLKKSTSEISSTKEIPFESYDPIYIVDGKRYLFASELKNLNPKDVESVDVLKYKDAKNKYGEDAKNGVVIIKTKKKADTIK